MNEILNVRLVSQLIANDEKHKATKVVMQLTGIQAQDEGGARWSIGLRIPGSTELDLIHSIETREFLRTWLFRGTMHYAACEDLGWLLKLLAPTVIKSNARRYEQLGLSSEDFAKSCSVISRLLQVDPEATRGELKQALNVAGIYTEGQRLPYLLQRAALDGLIYISGMRGREMTFRLLSELDLPYLDYDRTKLLSKLAERYFHGHGLAKLHDFAWWSGLPINDVREGLANCEGIQEFAYQGENYWFIEGDAQKTFEPFAVLLPPFDEFLLGYRGRELALEPAHTKFVNRGGGMFKSTFLIDGRVAGTWRKIDRKEHLQVEILPFATLTSHDKDLIDQAAHRLSEFYGKPVEVCLTLP